VDIVQFSVNQMKVRCITANCRQFAAGINGIAMQSHCCHDFPLFTVVETMTLGACRT
jgi:hypothetical protein